MRTTPTFRFRRIRGGARPDVEVTLKGAISGAGIAALCCFEGLSAGRAPTEIPQAVTRGVVDSLLFVVGLAGLFAVLRYL